MNTVIPEKNDPGVGWGWGGGGSNAEKTSREKTFSRDSRDAGVSLPGSLAASFAFGSARSGFEATPVVDADHGESESHRRRR